MTVKSIVLVAGLGGDYVKTWRADDETLWPRDLLPKSIPDIRVLSFQYNTTIQGTTSRAKITDHAVQLLNALHLDRETDDTAATRPIIFVGHSLGGILIKSAINRAHKNLKYMELWESTRGVVRFPCLGQDRRAVLLTKDSETDVFRNSPSWHEQLILAELCLGGAVSEFTVSGRTAHEEDAE